MINYPMYFGLILVTCKKICSTTEPVYFKKLLYMVKKTMDGLRMNATAPGRYINDSNELKMNSFSLGVDFEYQSSSTISNTWMRS